VRNWTSLAAQVGAGRAGQHDHTVLVPLAAADHDLAPRQVDILDAQLAALQQAQTTTGDSPLLYLMLLMLEPSRKTGLA
jgi:hypothetical protein